MKNAFLDAQINLILNTNSPATFGIYLNVSSVDDLEFSFSPLMIDSLNIVQNFENAICDDITVSFKISYKEYAQLYDHQSSLIGVLRFEYRDSDCRPVVSLPNIVRNYRVVLVDPIDIHKQVPDAYLRNTLDTTLTLRLIENTVYNLRLTKVNGIFSGTNIADTIRHVTREFGIKQIHMVPPDNTQVYTHIIIPPVKDFKDCYNYLHQRYGVYMQGIIAYITDDILYVYPPFDTTPESDKTMVVYQADIGQYGGITSTYKLSDMALSIVTSNVGHVCDFSVLGSENEGNTRTFMRGSSVINGVIEPTNENTIEFKDNNILNLSLKNSKMINPDAQHVVYTDKPTDNPFVLGSKLSKTQAMLLDFEWTKAIPFSIEPGMKVSYYSDVGGLISTRYGILEVIQYKFMRTRNSAYGENYIGMANVTVRLSPSANIAGTNVVNTSKTNPIVTAANILKN